tara:strand:+ start:323 stop:553 length:231 start_codon:yes stop_codon:yes gene_type:complete
MKRENKKIVKKIIANSIETSLSSIEDRSSSKDFPKWDSLANVKIMLQLEKKFKIKVKSKDTSKLNKVSEIYKLIET